MLNQSQRYEKFGIGP